MEYKVNLSESEKQFIREQLEQSQNEEALLDLKKEKDRVEQFIKDLYSYKEGLIVLNNVFFNSSIYLKTCDALNETQKNIQLQLLYLDQISLRIRSRESLKKEKEIIEQFLL